jgi:hypothetical protein
MSVSSESYESKPRKPRKPVVLYATGDLMVNDALALMRLTWYSRGRPRWVEEFCVWDTPEGYSVIEMAMRQAVEHGVDVLVISRVDPEVFGLCKC